MCVSTIERRLRRNYYYCAFPSRRSVYHCLLSLLIITVEPDIIIHTTNITTLLRVCVSLSLIVYSFFFLQLPQLKPIPFLSSSLHNGGRPTGLAALPFFLRNTHIQLLVVSTTTTTTADGVIWFISSVLDTTQNKVSSILCGNLFSLSLVFPKTSHDHSTHRARPEPLSHHHKENETDFSPPPFDSDTS